MDKRFSIPLYKILTTVFVILLVFISCLTILLSSSFFISQPSGFISRGYTPDLKYMTFAISIAVATITILVASYKSMLRDSKINKSFLLILNYVASFLSFIILESLAYEVSDTGSSENLILIILFLFIFILATIPSIALQFAIKKHGIKEYANKVSLPNVFGRLILLIILFCISFAILWNASW